MSNTGSTEKFWAKHGISNKAKPMKKFENTPKDKSKKSDYTDEHARKL